LECCQQLHIGTASENQVILSNRTVKVADFPIGIDYKKFANGIKSKSVQLEILKLQLKYRRYKIILTVDRLDPSKGFIERLEAYSEFLYLNPNLHKKVKMVMLTIPSRTDVKAYKVLKIRIDELVRKINRTYGTNNWQPIDFMYQSVPFEVLSALYQIADVAFVVPTKDGMNLVAKEYVASQQGHNGVLVLSETAGAAQELTDAVLVNPKKRQSIVAGLELALAMPQAALTIRLTSMQKQLAKNTIQTWAKGFMNSMEKTLPAQPLLTKQLNNSRLNDLTRSYLAAKKRLMLFDYDGVLVRFYDKPGDAVLKRSTYKLLAKLAEEPKNTIAIISGRPKVDMDRWLGALGIGLAAEHGGYIKQKNVWRCTADNSHDWKQTIIAIMQYYAASTPGAFVEEKNLVLAWHYRTSPPYLAQKNLVVLKRVLLPYLRQYGLQFFDGKKVLEVKSPNVNKAVAVRHWFNTSYDFVMVIGDDYTDEDMFSAVPARSYTIKVGAGKTAAKFRVKNVAAVTEILEKLN
jgi:trehalose 6-phosphate synthase/phosphatase